MDPSPRKLQPSPLLVVIEEMEEYVIAEVLDSCMYRKTPQYLIRWVGYPHPSWEPAEYHCHTAAITTYHDKYSTKPGPWYDKEGEEI
jgi:hypothetical protein